MCVCVCDCMCVNSVGSETVCSAVVKPYVAIVHLAPLSRCNSAKGEISVGVIRSSLVCCTAKVAFVSQSHTVKLWSD